MTDFRRIEDLGQVVLDRRTVARVEWPDAQVAEGRGIASAAGMAAALFVPAGVPGDEVCGEIAARRGAPEIDYRLDSGVQVVSVYSNGDPEAVTVDPSHQSLRANLARSPIVVALSDGRLIELLPASGAGFVVNALSLPARAVAEIAPPSDDVLAGNNDRWLCERVRWHWAVGDPWHVAVAAGLATTSIPTGGASWRSLTARASWPHVWMQQLSPSQQSMLLELSAATVAVMFDDLNVLDESFDPDDPGWRSAVIEFCQRRDELEGVVSLLRWAGCVGDLAAALEPLDAAAAAFVRAIPVVFIVDNEQLRRSAKFSPGAWWVLVDA